MKIDKQITSRDNPAVRQYTLLASSRKARQESGLFVTEGFKLTTEAMGTCRLHTLFATKAAMEKYEFVEDAVLVSDSVAKKLSASVTPQGIFAVFKKPAPKEMRLTSTGRFLLLAGLQDPGNVGTILRSAAAFGVTGVFLSSDCPDPFSMKVLRASMGGVFRLALETRDLEDAISTLHKQSITVWAAALDDRAVSLRDAVLGAGHAVVIGNEGGGLGQNELSLCDKTIMIPMVPGNESLNAAIAAGILLWEMTR